MDCESSNLTKPCSSCHDTISLSEGENVSEEEWLKLLHAAWSRGERLIDLAAVYEWVQQHRPHWEERGLTIEIRPPTTAAARIQWPCLSSPRRSSDR